METETRDAIRSRLDGINVPALERYLSIGIGAAAVGLGSAAWFIGPGRASKIAGAAITATGVALIVRGVSGRCPVTRAMARRDQPTAVGGDDALFAGDNQGEGDRRAARSYNEHVRDFIDDDRVEPAARAAAIAIEGPEGPGLRAAEEEGKAPMKPGPM